MLLWRATEACWVENVFPPDDIWFGSNTDTNLEVIYYLLLDV